MTEQEIRKAIVEVAHSLAAKGVVGQSEGNLSVRCGDRVYLTPSHKSKEYLTEDQIIVTDLDGNKILGEGKPTSETIMHTLCYKKRPDIGAVCHTHSPFGSAWAWANKPIEIKENPEFAANFGIVPCLPFGEPGTEHIIDGIDEFIDDYDCFLLANHGVLSLGEDIFAAADKVISLEMQLKTAFIRSFLGNAGQTDIPEDIYQKTLEFGRKVARGRHDK